MRLDVPALLDSLGLSQYAERFTANDIDAASLLQLRDEHLKELGLSLGHRVRLLNALTELRSAAPGEVASAPGEGDARHEEESERRQLTVMFCDLVGSSELSARTDPEEMREIIRAYHQACARTVARFEGHVAQYLGDGVLAYFGYPLAHEDAAERAVRAALAALAAVQALKGDNALRARVGIATGTVVVGKQLAANRTSELSAIGDAPNLAARLQSLAQPGCLVIAETTRALARGSFHYRDLGALVLKGFQAPVRAWEVLGEAAANRFEAARTGGFSRFVGREEEVALLQSRWQQSIDAEGQAVFLCGEAGIGKSRIAEQFQLALREVEHTRVRYQCSPFHASSALQPVVSQLEFAAGFASKDDNDARLAKLERLMQANAVRRDDVLPLFASLLALDTRGKYPAPALTPDAIRKRTLEALADELLALSRIKPVFWHIEDAHWIDPTTRELVGMCLARIRDARVFMLISFRPEFISPWANLPHVTGITLNRLARRQSVTLVEQVAGGPLPPPVLEQILGKTEGIPLFIEELTKAVLESGLLSRSDGAYALDGLLPPMAIPATLQDSLMARLDRLAPVKEVAQIGAAIGREFSYDLLAALAPMPAAQLDDALSRLAAAELVYARGAPPDSSYVFKHALVQEAAYSSLLRARRQQLHSHIAEVLQQKSPERVARHPELLAFHYEAAGLDELAKRQWGVAAENAMQRSDYAEAGSHFAHALVQLRKEPECATRRREEARLLLGQAITVQVLRGPGSVDAGRIADEALSVSAPLGDDVLHFRARWADWLYNSLAGNLPAASQRANVLVDMARRLAQDEAMLQAHHARWTTGYLRGEVSVSRNDLEQGLALYDMERHKGHWAIYGAHDPGVCARATGACTLWQAGLPERGAALSVDAVSLADRVSHPFSRAVALWYSAFFAMMNGDAQSAGRHAGKLGQVATEFKMLQPLGIARFIDGWVTSRGADLGRGSAQMESAFADFLKARQRGYLPFLGTFIASARLEMGKVEPALAFLDELQQLALETHQQMFASEIRRLRAQALSRRDSKDPRIEEELRSALEIAGPQGARALELRAATDLARWLARRGRRSAAHDLLKPLYETFSEGAGGAELETAKTTLGELA